MTRPNESALPRIAWFLLLVTFAANGEPAPELFPELHAVARKAPPEIETPVRDEVARRWPG